MKYTLPRGELPYDGIRPSHLVGLPPRMAAGVYEVAFRALHETTERMVDTHPGVVFPLKLAERSIYAAAIASRAVELAVTFSARQVEGLFLGR